MTPYWSFVVKVNRSWKQDLKKTFAVKPEYKTKFQIIGLLQQTITWYKIRHAGEQAHYYSPTGTLKQRDLNQSSLTCLCFNVPVGK